MILFLVAVAILILIFGMVFLYRIIPAIWMIYKFEKFQKERIDYETLKKKAEELKDKFPWYIYRSEEYSTESIFTYTGLAITINRSVFGEDDVLLLCKTTNQHGNLQILGSPFVEIETDEYPDISRYYDLWEFNLSKLINDNWKKVTLKSEWREGCKIIKHCLLKDDYVLIYDIDKIEN